MRFSTFQTGSVLSALLSTASAVNTVEVHGQDFVDSVTNNRFVVIGVDYQPGGQGAYGAANSADPLSNATACLRDAALMQQLGVNTIRSYNVDPSLNHDECASIFNSVGIYMILDVNSPLAGESIDRTNPSGTYTTSYLEHIFMVVEAFKNYPNVLGFFAGNEIINDETTGQANPPYIRAVQRDLKNYIAAHAPRTIPVGYSAADVRPILQAQSDYLQCDNNDNSGSDFFGLNSYSWCGSDATFQTSQYDTLVELFSNSSIPVFFSEYGCNKVSPRVFDEVPVLYGPQMTALSGGLVYEWSQEQDNYGLVQINADASAQLLQDYDALQGQYAQLNFTLLEDNNGTATGLTPPACSAGLITATGFSTDFNIPSPPDGAEALISSGVSSAPTGSIVPVTETTVAVPVSDVSGSLISGLVIHATSGANRPTSAASSSSQGSDTSSGGASQTGASGTSASRTGSSQTGASQTGTGTASSSTSTHTGSANRLSGAAALAIGAGLLAL